MRAENEKKDHLSEFAFLLVSPLSNLCSLRCGTKMAGCPIMRLGNVGCVNTERCYDIADCFNKMR